MKKVMFVVVLLLVASTCFAQLQSGPSNTVGYVKIVATASGYTPFGLPFKFWDVVSGTPQYGVISNQPSDIVGDQANCGSFLTADRILRQDNGQNAYRAATACAWTGLLESGSGMTPGRAYWYQNRTASNRNLVLAGEVDNSGNYATVSVTNNAYVPYSWRDSRSVNRDDLNLVASGFMGGTFLTSDRIVSQTGGTNFYYTGSAWSGTLVTVEPGAAYWIHNRNHANGAWNYNYDASGATVVQTPPASKDDNSGSISKVGSSKVTSKSGSGSARE